MGLYDRDYVQTNQYEAQATQSESQLVAFIKETYKLFGASMMAGAVGAYIGLGFAAEIHSMKWMLLILEIGLLIGLHFVKTKPGINLAVLFAFTFMTGITLAPLLSMAITVDPMIVGNAFAMTALIFGGMSLFAIKTPTDFTTYTKPLMIALIVVVVFSLLNALVFQSPMASIIISGVVVMLFSVLIVFDTQNIIRGNYEHPIDGAIALYLDFLNIFTALLQLLLSFNGRDE
ncbi:MAG: membrane protein [Sulfuricurvum sp. PC08-66]|nr:MAG: membrane protein [Sulfuricurvum sp. PC08-66]